MSKSIRISDYLYAEVERLASEEKRSLANMVAVLLEQALRMKPTVSADAQPRDAKSRAVDPHFKPDFKK